jgi:DNA polymerase-1
MNLIFDSNFMCHRAKHAMKNSNLSYEHMKTEIIFNFLQQLLSLTRKFEPKTIVFTWDSRKSHRKKIYPDYKAKDDAELTEEEKDFNDLSYKQFTQLKRDILPTLGFSNIFTQTGFEADDIIASIVLTEEDENIIVSADGDLYQLLNHCKMYNPNSRRMITASTFKERYGIDPDQWDEVKSMAGCGGGPSKVGDNVNGIKGVAETTAIKYLLNYLPPKYKSYQSIVSKEGKAIIRRNKKLVSLPFRGTKIFHLQKDYLYAKDFLDIFYLLGFKSFTVSDEFREWELAFNLR